MVIPLLANQDLTPMLPLSLSSDVIDRKTEHKHLGMILQENLDSHPRGYS